MSDLVADLRYLADSPSFTFFHSEDERAGICEKCNADFSIHSILAVVLKMVDYNCIGEFLTYFVIKRRKPRKPK